MMFIPRRLTSYFVIFPFGSTGSDQLIFTVEPFTKYRLLICGSAGAKMKKIIASITQSSAIHIQKVSMSDFKKAVKTGFYEIEQPKLLIKRLT